MLQITITNSSLCLLQNSRNLCLVPDSLWLPASGTCASVCFQTKLPGGGRGTATSTEEPLGEPLPGQPGGTRRQQRAKGEPFVNRSGSPPSSPPPPLPPVPAMAVHYCSLCRRTSFTGRRHLYSTGHRRRLREALEKLQEEVGAGLGWVRDPPGPPPGALLTVFPSRRWRRRWRCCGTRSWCGRRWRSTRGRFGAPAAATPCPGTGGEGGWRCRKPGSCSTSPGRDWEWGRERGWEGSGEVLGAAPLMAAPQPRAPSGVSAVPAGEPGGGGAAGAPGAVGGGPRALGGGARRGSGQLRGARGGAHPAGLGVRRAVGHPLPCCPLCHHLLIITELLSPQIAASIREAERRQQDTVRAALQVGAEPLLGAGPAALSSTAAPPR